MVDRAAILDAGSRRQLERLLAAYEKEAGHQVVVHTTPSLEGLPIEDYSIRVADAWRIGHKGLDNGVILTVAPSERAVRIEVGYGLEGVIPDAIAARIVRDFILPAFQRGDLAGGVMAGVQQILSAAEGEKLATPPAAAPRATPVWVVLLWILLVLLLVGLRGLSRGPAFGRRRGLGWDAGLGFPSGSRRSGSAGFGGFRGGGGGFGGGGASGRW